MTLKLDTFLLELSKNPVFYKDEARDVWKNTLGDIVEFESAWLSMRHRGDIRIARKINHSVNLYSASPTLDMERSND